MAIALLYHLEGTEKGRKLRPLLLKLGIRARPVEEAEFSLPLAALAGLEPEAETRDPEPADALPLQEEMLVLAGLRPGQLDALLTALRQAKASVDLKAVLTEHNGHGSGRYLQSQLIKEREAVLAWRRGQGSSPAHPV